MQIRLSTLACTRSTVCDYDRAIDDQSSLNGASTSFRAHCFCFVTPKRSPTCRPVWRAVILGNIRASLCD